MKAPTNATYLITWTRRLALILAGLIFIFGWLEPQSSIDVANSLHGPEWVHPFGFDSLGRSLLSRISSGTINSLIVAIGGSLIALAIGIAIGAMNVFYLRRLDSLFLKTLDILNTIPNFIYVVAIGGLLWTWPPSIRLCVSTGLVHWIIIARLVRLKIYEIEKQDYIIATQALGASRMRLLFYHIIPQFAEDLLLIGMSQFSAILSQEAFISFIGFGFSPPDTSLGLLLQDGWRMLGVSPHLVFGPGLMLMLILYSMYSLRTEKFSKEFRA